MNVFHYFERELCAGADRAAIVSGLGKSRRSVSYRELSERVDRAVHAFRRGGLQPGNRLLLAVPLSIETYVAMLAALKAGLVIMYVDPAHGRKTIDHCLREHPPAAMVATRRGLSLRFLSRGLRRIPKYFSVDRPTRRAKSICGGAADVRAGRAVRRATGDPALLTFTSGSTGTPKAAIRSHGFLKTQLDALSRLLEVRDNDVELVAMPMFVLFNLASGITSILPASGVKRPAKVDAKKLVAQLQQELVTRIVASPALLERLTKHCGDTAATLECLRHISTGGGPVAPTLPGRLRSVAPKANILSVYGSTEAEPIASVEDSSVSDADRRRTYAGGGLLAGRPVDGCDVRIIARKPDQIRGPCTMDEFEKLSLATNRIGEIVVSGEHVLRGYADPARDVETKIDVAGRIWHRTGDAGYFDECGRLWLVGRCNAAISDARGTVYPFQAEFALTDMSGIRRAALVAHGSRRVLVFEKNADKAKLDMRSLKTRLGTIGIDEFIVVRRIPMDKRHNAKVDYLALGRLLKTRIAMLPSFLVVSGREIYGGFSVTRG
jgi:acyl-CoA synthetase (AMP-forming)/AMP-acid ligase II